MAFFLPPGSWYTTSGDFTRIATNFVKMGSVNKSPKTSEFVAMTGRRQNAYYFCTDLAAKTLLWQTFSDDGTLEIWEAVVKP